MAAPARKRQDNPTFVLLHYMGGSHRTWFPTRPLIDRDHHCVAIDTPGYGDAATVRGWSVAEMADYFEARIAELGLTRVILVGHSMTCKVAMVLAARRPAFLHSLILVGASPLSPQPMSDSERDTQLAFANRRDQAEVFVDGASGRRLPDAIREVAIADVIASNTDAFHSWARTGMLEDWSARVDAIECPALVVCGELDRSVPPAEAQRKLTLPHLRHGSIVTVPAAGHLMPMEAPLPLSRILLAFAAECHSDPRVEVL